MYIISRYFTRMVFNRYLKIPLYQKDVFVYLSARPREESLYNDIISGGDRRRRLYFLSVYTCIAWLTSRTSDPQVISYPARKKKRVKLVLRMQGKKVYVSCIVGDPLPYYCFFLLTYKNIIFRKVLMNKGG